MWLKGRCSATALEIVAAIERGAKRGEFVEIPGHCILDQIVGRAPAPLNQFLQAGLGLRTEVDFHAVSLAAADEFSKNPGMSLLAKKWGVPSGRIPNTEAKPRCANCTARGSVWESR